MSAVTQSSWSRQSAANRLTGTGWRPVLPVRLHSHASLTQLDTLVHTNLDTFTGFALLSPEPAWSGLAAGRSAQKDPFNKMAARGHTARGSWGGPAPHRGRQVRT